MVAPKEEAMSTTQPHERITVRCKRSGFVLDHSVRGSGVHTWTCSCGFFYEKAYLELDGLPDEIDVSDMCEHPTIGRSVISGAAVPIATVEIDGVLAVVNKVSLIK